MNKKRYGAIVLALMSTGSFAVDETILIPVTAPYSYPDQVLPEVQAECGLPGYQSAAVRREVEALGIKVVTTPTDEVPVTGKFLKVAIAAAVSSGHAWGPPFSGGHKKYMKITATFFQDGKEVDDITRHVYSHGGAFSGSKRSCTVLENCADALAKQIAIWIKTKLEPSEASRSKITEETVPVDSEASKQ